MINFIQETKFFHRQSDYFVFKSWNKFWEEKIKMLYYISFYPFAYFKYMWSAIWIYFWKSSEENESLTKK